MWAREDSLQRDHNQRVVKGDDRSLPVGSDKGKGEYDASGLQGCKRWVLARGVFSGSEGGELLLYNDQAALGLGTKDKHVGGGVPGSLDLQRVALLAQDLGLGCQWLDLGGDDDVCKNYGSRTHQGL